MASFLAAFRRTEVLSDLSSCSQQPNWARFDNEGVHEHADLEIVVDVQMAALEGVRIMVTASGCLQTASLTSRCGTLASTVIENPGPEYPMFSERDVDMMMNHRSGCLLDAFEDMVRSDSLKSPATTQGLAFMQRHWTRLRCFSASAHQTLDELSLVSATPGSRLPGPMELWPLTSTVATLSGFYKPEAAVITIQATLRSARLPFSRSYCFSAPSSPSRTPAT